MEEPKPRLDTRYIPALDGLRAVAILIIVWYHLWQQSWLSPVLHIPVPFGQGLVTLSLEVIPRTGYLFVDLMLLLSAFCLFLPHARAMVLGEPVPGARAFYWKRVARIVPPYWLSAILLFAYALATGAYGAPAQALRDLFATLTFTQMFSPETYLSTHINGVLWTAAVEAQFYLLFPLLASAFRKKPLLTYLGMAAVSALYLRGFALHHPDTLRLTLNQLPGFFGVFANGMAAALFYVYAAKALSGRRAGWLAPAALLGVALSLYCLNRLQHGAAAAQEIPIFQAQYRFLLSLAFTLLVLSLSFGGRAFSLMLGNREMRFFAAISYNLYIWHQWIAVRLKEWRIPYWEGTELPNIAGNRAWQEQYTLLVFLVAIALAAFLTYCYEHPVGKRLLRLASGKGKESPNAV